jgi:hypothetical protein
MVVPFIACFNVYTPPTNTGKIRAVFTPLAKLPCMLSITYHDIAV